MSKKLLLISLMLINLSFADDQVESTGICMTKCSSELKVAKKEIRRLESENRILRRRCRLLDENN